MSIAYATRLGLGPTNPGLINMAQETLLFRWVGFSPTCYCYSFQHSHFLTLHQASRPSFTADRNAPLPLPVKLTIQSFGNRLSSPVKFSAQDLLTSELLRTL